ncbi:MAG: porin family protein [Proteobacteria bacterium]|nr:porin family protein [Pseudomonadota bacterium]
MAKLKLAFLASAVLMATNVQADWQGNFLLGVSAGGAWHNNDEDITVTLTLPPDSVSFSGANDNNGDHFIWGFLGGYQARCNNWLAGLEVNVDWRGNDDDVNVAGTIAGDPVIATISRDNDAVVGITARLGYNILPCLMPYIRLGADYSDRDFDFVGFEPVSGITVSSNDDNGNDRWGFVGGVGLEYFMPMIAGLSLRAEWDYHSRGHHDDITGLASDGETLWTISNGGNHHEQTARASLVYNFPS